MDLPITGKDFLIACSDYSCLVTDAKTILKKLEDEMKPHAQEIVKCLSEKTFKSFADLDDVIELWLRDLKAQLNQFEMYGRVSTLRTFFHLSSYLHTVRPPVVRLNEPRYSVPVRHIVFPKNEDNELFPLSLKLKARAPKKCSNKNSSQTNVCR